MSASRPSYDVVVVGARAAGAATAMLAARAGLRVLVLDRGRYGADTLSTHALMRAGVLQLQRWGLLAHVLAARTPAVRGATFHFRDGDLPLDLEPRHGVDALYAPRRTVLDPILVDAARDAGADVRFGVRVHGLRRGASGRVTGVEGQDPTGRSFAADAALVVGADGRGSVVAEQVRAPVEHRGVAASAFVYGYWSGIPVGGYHWVFTSGGSAGLIPTNEDLVCVFAGGAGGRAHRSDFWSMLRSASPVAADLVACGESVGPVRTFPGVPGYLRRAWGPGWALVGDAGYWKDPISAHGLTDALRDAELLSRAITQTAGGVREGEALRGYQATRDRLSLPLFRVTDRIAAHTWTDRQIPALLRDLALSATDEVETLAGLPTVLAGRGGVS